MPNAERKMDQVPGYAAALARYRVEQERQKPLLGKPFLRYGQCFALIGYFFQVGGVLGSRYRSKLDEFGWAFLGMTGEAGALTRFYAKVAERLLPQAGECASITDLVTRSELEKLQLAGGLGELLTQYGMRKVSPDAAARICLDYAMEGSVVGALQPDLFRRLFEETNKKRDEESWRSARAYGLDIPEEQDVITYDEAERGEVESFLEWCQQYAPRLRAALAPV